MDLPYTTDDLPTAFEDGYTSDQQVCQVEIGEYEVTDSGNRLVAYGLGSCVGVALYDQKARVAGLIHIKRPTTPTGTECNRAAFADTGIRMLFDQMRTHGATAHHTEATVAGGIDTGGAASAVDMNIGQQNIRQARQTLDALDIPISESAVGGDEMMSVYFDGETGEVSFETNSTDREQFRLVLEPITRYPIDDDDAGADTDAIQDSSIQPVGDFVANCRSILQKQITSGQKVC